MHKSISPSLQSTLLATVTDICSPMSRRFEPLTKAVLAKEDTAFSVPVDVFFLSSLVADISKVGGVRGAFLITVICSSST